MKARLAKKIVDAGRRSPHRRWSAAHRLWARRCWRAVRGRWACGAPGKRSGLLWELEAQLFLATLLAPEKLAAAIEASPLLQKFVYIERRAL